MLKKLRRKLKTSIKKKLAKKFLKYHEKIVEVTRRLRLLEHFQRM